MTAILSAIADWHANKACAAYSDHIHHLNCGDTASAKASLEVYCRHISICDRLRRKAKPR